MDTSTVPTNKIEYENLILKGRNIGYDALIYEEKNIHFNYLNSKVRDRLGVNVLNDDILKTLGIMNGDNYTIAAALLSDNNPINHADIFLRLGIIERLATGIRRIREYYKNSGVNPEFLIAQNSIKVILPKINQKTNSSEPLNKFGNNLNENELKLMKYVKSAGRITRKEAENILSLKKTQTAQVLGEMVDNGVLLKVGAGRNTSYVANV